MSKLRKIFTISVMMVTVLSMSVVVAPQAEAAASSGDLIKMEGLASIYYLAADGKRYVFPNESTYFSWYSDFSSVVTVSQSELEGYPLGANVTVRPGTKLVKITTNPKVFAVESDGSLVWVPSETVAKALYGDAWAGRVVDVADSFWNNYTETTGAVSATAYPEGSLVKFGDAADVYYIAGDGKARKVADEAAFVANRFNWDDVITSTLDMPTAGAEVSGVEATITDTSSGSGGTIGAGSGLTVALSANNPISDSIIADSNATGEYSQALIPFTKVNFTAASDGAVKVTTVKFTRKGIASDGDLGNLYLYDGTTRVAEYTSFSDKVVTFTNSSGLFTVGAGTTKEITLKGDLAKVAAGVSSGKTIGFTMTAASDITTDGAAVSGSFPVSGNLMSTASVSDLGHLYFGGASGSNGTYPSTVKADEANKQLWSVNLTADGQDMEISKIRYTMVGTIAATDIQNIELELAGVKIAGPVNMDTDKTVTFDLTGSPIEITTGQTKSLAIRGDMMGGSGRVFKFTIQKTSDIVLMDTNYGIYMTPNVNNTTTAFGVVQGTTGNGTTVSSGTLTLGVANDSPIGNIPDGSTAVEFAKFTFYAAGEAVKVDSLSVICNGDTTTRDIVNIKLLLDGTQVGTTDATMNCDNSETADYTFSNTFVIPAGTTKYLSVVGDTTDSAVAADDTYQMKLKLGSGNAAGQNTLTSISTTAQSGRTLTVKAGTVTVIENVAFGDRSTTNPTGTVSAPAAQIGSFIVTAGAGEAVDVSQISLSDDTTSILGDNFQNLKLKAGSASTDGTYAIGDQVGSTVSSLNTSAGTYTFTPSTSIRIAAGAQFVVNVHADIMSSPADSGTAAALLTPVVKVTAAGITATGVSTGTSATSANTILSLQNAYIAAQGNLTITLDGNTPSAQQMVMGATDQEVARFKLTADAAENINITEIYMTAAVKSGATGTFSNIKLYVDGEQVGSASNFGDTSTTTSAVAPFVGLDLTIPVDGSKVLVVKADVSTSANATSADTAVFGLVPDYDGSTTANQESIVAKGSSSGQGITAGYLDFTTSDSDIDASTMTVYATKLSVAFDATTPTGSAYATGADDQIMAKIVVTNSANVSNYEATIKYMNFAITQSGASKPAGSAAVELKVYKNGVVQLANLVATTTFLAENENIGATAFENGTSSATNFIDTVISAGESETFVVTLDTNILDMGSDTGSESISIGMASDDLGWTDGVGASDITSVNDLPLTSETLAYPSS